MSFPSCRVVVAAVGSLILLALAPCAAHADDQWAADPPAEPITYTVNSSFKISVQQGEAIYPARVSKFVAIVDRAAHTVYDLSTGARKGQVLKARNALYEPALSEDGKLIASGIDVDGNASIVITDVTTGNATKVPVADETRRPVVLGFLSSELLLVHGWRRRSRRRNGRSDPCAQKPVKNTSPRLPSCGCLWSWRFWGMRYLTGLIVSPEPLGVGF